MDNSSTPHGKLFNKAVDRYDGPCENDYPHHTFDNADDEPIKVCTRCKRMFARSEGAWVRVGYDQIFDNATQQIPKKST